MQEEEPVDSQLGDLPPEDAEAIDPSQATTAATTSTSQGTRQRQRRLPRGSDHVRTAPCSRANDGQAFWVESVNASGWQGARDLVVDAGPEVRVVLVQEHKIADATEASTALSAMGWHSVWTPAEVGQGGGWSAGTAVLVRKTHGVRASLPIHDARAVACLVDLQPGQTVCFASVYGKTGESANGPTNHALHERLARLAGDMKREGIPLVMGGDWNLTPDKVSQLSWVRQREMTVVHAGEAQLTCRSTATKGRVLDYFMVSREAEAAVQQAQVRHDVPMFPHKPVRLIMDDQWAKLTTMGLKTAPPIPNDRRIGPPVQPPCYQAARDLALQARWAAAHSESRRATTKKLFRATQAWTWLAAQEIANAANMDPDAFRPERYGRTPGLQQKRIIPRQSKGQTTRLRQAYDQEWCREAAGRLWKGPEDDRDDAQRRLEGADLEAACQQRLAQIPAAEDSPEKRTLQQLGTIAGQVAQTGDIAPGTKLSDLAVRADPPSDGSDGPRSRSTDADYDSPDHAREASWRQWAVEATADGAARGHAWTKTPAAWQPTVTRRKDGETSAPQAIAHAQEEAFASKWKATHTPIAAEALPPRHQRETLPRLHPEQLRRLSRAFPKRTAYGTDGIHVTQYAWLSDASLECFSTLLQSMELARRPPPQWRTMKTPLIPKKEAGKFRAVAVMASPLRMWGKARRAECDEWETAHHRDYFAAGEGQRPLAAVWRAALTAERRSGEQAQSGGMVCHDLEAFYDNIQHNVLRQAAREHGMSATLLETALASYTGPRYLAVDGFGASATLHTDQGVMAGCSLCTTWAKLATLDPMDAVVRKWGPRTVGVNLYIDDVVMCTYGSDNAVVTRLGGATETLIEEMWARGISLAEGKTAVAASSQALGRRLCQAMQVDDHDGGTRATFLGCDYAAGRTKRKWARKSAARKRCLAMQARRARVQRLRKAGGGQATRHIVVAGLLPQGTYASEVHGLSDQEWRTARLTSVAASGGAANGQSWQRRLLTEGDCTAGAMGAPLVAWVAETWAAQERRPRAATPTELQTSWQMGEDRAVRRWCDVRGPVDAIRLTLQRLRWTWEGPWDWYDDRGATIDLRQVTPRLMRQMIADAVRRGLERQVGQRLRAKQWHGLPGAASAAAVNRVLAGKHLTPKEKGSLRAVVSDSIWPQQRLAEHGYETTRLCALCGAAEDTIHHRVWCCPATEDLRKEHADLTTAARAAGPRSALFNLGGLLPSRADDKPQANDQQVSPCDHTSPTFQRGRGTVYVDGSATTPGIPELRRASWAAVQIDDDTGEEVASATGTVPAAWPQTAQAAEHCGLWETAVRTEAKVCVVGDCAGVVNESRKLKTRPDSRAWEQKMYGGLWRRARQSQALPSLLDMQKVKAHQAWRTVQDEEERRKAKGNDRADELAKQALQQHPRWAKHEYAEVAEEWEQALVIAEITGRAVARWPKATRSERRRASQTELDARATRQEAKAKATAARKQAEATRNRAATASHAWQTWQGQTRCIACGVRKQQRAAATPCTATRPKVCQIADAARTRGHQQLQVATVLAPAGHSTGLLLFCGTCGACSQGGQAKSRLDDECSPTNSGRYALSRIKRGLHPRATSQWRGYLIDSMHQLGWEELDEDGAEGGPPGAAEGAM